MTTFGCLYECYYATVTGLVLVDTLLCEEERTSVHIAAVHECSIHKSFRFDVVVVHEEQKTCHVLQVAGLICTHEQFLLQIRLIQFRIKLLMCANKRLCQRRNDDAVFSIFYFFCCQQGDDGTVIILSHF